MNNFPDDFNINSDYATISHVGDASVQLVLPAGLSIPPSTNYVQKKEMDLVATGILRLLVSTSKYPHRKVVSSSMSLTRNFKVDTGETTPTTVLIVGWLQSNGVAACSLSIPNVFNTTLFYTGGTEVFTVEARAMTLPY